MQHPQPTSVSHHGVASLQAVGLLLFAALVAMVGWKFGGDSLQQDPDAYAQLAVTWAEVGTLAVKAPDGTVHPTAYRPPLYPWLLSWLVTDGRLNLAAVFVFHMLLICVLSVTVWDIARRLQIGWPWLPAMLVCIDPLMIRASQQVMTELLATTLAVVVWWLWLVLGADNSVCGPSAQSTGRSKTQCIALYLIGIFFGLSTLARPTAAIWAAVFVVCMLRFGCCCWKRRLIDIAAVIVGVVAVVLPWVARNWTQLGQPIWGTTHGGYTLLLANNPSLYHHFRFNGADRNWKTDSFHQAWAVRGKFDSQQLLQDEFWLSHSTSDRSDPSTSNSGMTVYSLGEVNDDKLAYEVAKHTIQNDPSTFAKSCVYRLAWFWSCWPNGVGKLQTAAIGTWYGVVFVLAAMGFRRMLSGCEKFLAGWLPAVALVLVLSAVHSVYWSNMRMRCPLMPCVYLLAVVGLGGRKPA